MYKLLLSVTFRTNIIKRIFKMCCSGQAGHGGPGKATPFGSIPNVGGYFA